MATAWTVTEALIDVNAFDAFYERTLPMIYGYFLHRCGFNVEISEDLTQETFLAAVRRITQGDPIDAPLPWLYGIARHKLLDHYRRQARGREQLIPWRDDAMGEIAAPEPDFTRDVNLERAIAALDQLPPMQKAAIVLRYLDGFSVPEIAKEMGRSLHATESLLTRGRANVKRALVEDDHA